VSGDDGDDDGDDGPGGRRDAVEPDAVEHDDAGDDATGGLAASGLMAVAVEELYGSDPQAFTGRRTELAAQARTAGDAAAAKAIAALRKPTRAAWVVNQLARTDPSAPIKLAELGAALRAAQQARHGPRLRELSVARGPLIDALTDQALAAGGVPDPPPSLRAEVAATLSAALADPSVAAGFASGTLTSAAHWAGFGTPEFGLDSGTSDEASAGVSVPARARGDEPTTDARAAETPTRARRADGERRADGVAQAEADRDAGPARRRRGEAGPGADASATAGTRATARRRRGAGESGADADAPTEAGVQAVPTRRRAAGERAADALAAARAGQQAEAERLAREAAERAALRRQTYEDAERSLASSRAATAEAGAAEDRLEAEVRDLEERLIRAKADLAAARLRARHTEAAERRARQTLERLPLE
jgi:hypothetical protein